MPCGRLTNEVQKRLTAISTTEEQVEFFTDWIPCTGIDEARVVMRIRGRSGDFGAKPSLQVASVRTNKPDSPVGFPGESYVSTNSDNYADVDLSSVCDDEFFIRFGVMYKITSSDVGSADVSLQVSYRAKGQIRGTMSEELVALNDSLSQRVVITEWIPAIEVSEFNVAYVSDADSDYQYKFAYQTAATTIEEPDSWTGVGSWISGDAEDNIGDQTPTTTDKMWIRIGVFYNCTATNSDKQGSLSAVVATRG
jgi:hypothetical protein